MRSSLASVCLEPLYKRLKTIEFNCGLCFQFRSASDLSLWYRCYIEIITVTTDNVVI